MFSTTITAPSTMMPKSIAPSESRFAGNAFNLQSNECCQKRQGNQNGNDRRGPEPPQKEKQHQANKRGAFREILEDGLQRVVDQPGAIVVGNKLNAFGQDAPVQFGDLGLHALQHDGWVLALSHQNRAVDDVVLGIHADHSLALLGSDCDIGNVLDEHRNTPAFRDNDVSNVLGSSKQSDTANDELLLSLLDIAAPGIHVPALERFEQLLHRNRVRLHCVLSGMTWYCLMKPPRVTTSATPGTIFRFRSTTQSSMSRKSIESYLSDLRYTR